MKVDELRRELQHQADEARLWPVPGLADLEAVRRRQRRRTAATTVLAAAAVATVVAVVPQLLPDNRPGRPGEVATSPAASPTTGTPTGRRTWTALTCAPRQLRDCSAPAQLSLGGVIYRYEDGGDTPTRYHGRTSTSLNLSVSGRGRSVLVGAAGSGEGSRLSVRIGSGEPVALEPGRLTLLPIDDSLTRPVEVVVTEAARPLPGEVLTIGVYHPVP